MNSIQSKLKKEAAAFKQNSPNDLLINVAEILNQKSTQNSINQAKLTKTFFSNKMVGLSFLLSLLLVFY